MSAAEVLHFLCDACGSSIMLTLTGAVRPAGTPRFACPVCPDVEAMAFTGAGGFVAGSVVDPLPPLHAPVRVEADGRARMLLMGAPPEKPAPRLSPDTAAVVYELQIVVRHLEAHGALLRTMDARLSVLERLATDAFTHLSMLPVGSGG